MVFVLMWRGGAVMFMVVSEYKDYMFVVDTDDDSCEMVKKKSMSGVDYTIQKSCVNSFAKLRLLYGLNPVDFIPYFGITGYTATYIFDTGGTMNCTMNVMMCIVPKNLKGVNDVYAPVYDSADFFMAAYVEPRYDSYKIPLSYNDYLQAIPVEDKILSGIVIPPEMASYMLRLSYNRNQKGVLRAFDGLFSEKLIVQLPHNCKCRVEANFLRGF